MGKRKRTGDRSKNKTDPLPIEPPYSHDNMPCSSGTESSYKMKSSNIVDTSEQKPLSSNIIADSAKLLVAHTPPAKDHHNHGRSIYLKRPRHYYGHHYSQRNSASHESASTSHGKGTPHEERLSFKLAQCNSEFGRFAENMENSINRPERIRASSLVMDALSADAVKMVCGICEKLLRRKPYIVGETLSSGGEYSVVAVLVCGHVYHADCLEGKTSNEDKRDPPCMLCQQRLPSTK